MSLTILQTSLFGPPLPKVIAHGVNAKGVMGKGVAAKVKKIFPAAYEQYKAVRLQPGDVHHWHAGDYHVFNLCTQQEPGPRASLICVGWSLEAMVELAAGHDITEVHMPKIGCGIGCLTWDNVEPVMARVAATTPIRFIVHDFDPAAHRRPGP